MSDTTPADTPTTMPRLITVREGIGVLVAGAVIGLAALAVYFLFEKYVFTPLFCGNAIDIDQARCEGKVYFASALAMVIAGLGGLFALVQQRVYRPLLVILLVTVGLWGVLPLMASGQWWVGALLSSLVFAISYLVFTWLVQLRNFYVALGVSALIVVVMRLILMS